ncbi:YcxB family protein [Streptomyces sp. MS19]|uniref:YcxB family protein n=1 Tax=Streptomyces sp. MS19 TaxID=3385972 RepID=UPI00399F6A64
MDHPESPAAVEQDVLTLEFMPTAADFREARDAAGQRTPWTYSLTLLLILGVAVAELLPLEDWYDAAVLAGIGVVASGVSYLAWRGLRHLLVWRRARHARSHGELVVRLDAEGLHVKDAFGEGQIPWTSFLRYAETAHLVLLVLGDRKQHVFALPRRAVVADADEDTLSAFVARHLPE